LIKNLVVLIIRLALHKNFENHVRQTPNKNWITIADALIAHYRVLDDGPDHVLVPGHLWTKPSGFDQAGKKSPAHPAIRTTREMIKSAALNETFVDGAPTDTALKLTFRPARAKRDRTKKKKKWNSSWAGPQTSCARLEPLLLNGLIGLFTF
jgi:hypothetical protein